MHNLHPGANKFAPARELEQICSWSKFAPGCKFLKHRSHGQKYTRGANLHPGANCAHERHIIRCSVKRAAGLYDQNLSKILSPEPVENFP